MKSILILLGCIATCAHCIFMIEDFREVYADAFDKCLEDQLLKIDLATIQMIRDDDFDDDRAVNCIQACILKRIDFMHDAKIDYEALDNFAAKLQPESKEKAYLIIAGFEACKEESEVSDDECTVLGKYQTCLKPFLKTLGVTDDESEESPEVTL